MIVRIVLVLLMAVPTWAQSGNEGSIEGTVADPSGAVVAGANVEVRNPSIGARFSTKTDENGWFGFPVLPVGSYKIAVEQQGFAKLIQQNVALSTGARVNLKISLQVAGRAESVVVTAEPPLVESTRSAVSSTVDARSVASLPLNGRNFLNLVLLTPGVTPGGQFFSTTGQGQANSLIVDGTDQNNFLDGPIGTAAPNRYLFSQEAIQEFQVNTSSYSAEFGRAGASVVNVVTKSGSNAFHGSAFWYYRDRGLNATGFINKLTGQPKDPFHVHQFGGALGGPIIKDKLFFYASYDGQRRAEQNVTFLNLPSNFQLSPNPAIAAFQQSALDYLTARADSWIRTFTQDVALAKLDWHVTPRHLLSARWNRHRLMAENFANGGPQQSLEHTGVVEQIADTYGVSLTSSLSASKVNVARFSYVTSAQPAGVNSSLPEASIFEGGQQVLLAGRAPRLPVDNAVNRGEWSDTLSLSHGHHSLKLGVNAMSDWGRFLSGANFFGSYRFNSLESFGRSLAQLPVCPALPQCRTPQASERYTQAFSGGGAPPISVNPNFVEVAGFVQDEWRLRPSFTLNLGTRYEVQIMSTSAVQNPSSALAAAGVDTRFVPTDSNNLAPRLGFAWSPLRSNRLVVRGGYGLYFPRLLGATAARAFFQNGITVETRTFAAGAPTASLIPAYPNTVCGPPDPAGAPPNCAAPTTAAEIIQAFSSGYKQPVVQQASFGFEHEVQRDLAVSVTYLGAKGTHLAHWQDINLNDPVPASIGIAGTTTVVTYNRYPTTRPISGFDRVLLFSTNGSSTYHGMALQVKKRFSNNFQFLGAYTLSKVIDDNPSPGGVTPGVNDGALVSDSRNLRSDRGPGNTDERHRFVFSGTWDLNYGKKLWRPARAILAGWELDDILTVDSGQPYSGLVNFDLNNDGNSATDRAPGTGRNTFYLPATVSLDTRLTRKVQLAEHARLEVSWDAFNAFNRANISAVRNAQYFRSASAFVCGIAGTPCLLPQNAGTSAFGTPTETLDPRIMQFSAKLQF